MKKQKNNYGEISLIQLSQKHHKIPAIYKVTKSFPLEGVQETKIFDDLEEAKKQLNKWTKERLK